MGTEQDQEKQEKTVGKKIFIVLVFAVLSVLAVAAPLTMKLEEKGIIEAAAAGMDLGEPPFHTGFLSGVLNSIERFKWGVKNAYTNYMPGYSEMVVTYNGFLENLNKPLEFLKTSEVDYPLDMPPEEEDPMIPPDSSTSVRPPESSSSDTSGDSSTSGRPPESSDPDTSGDSSTSSPPPESSDPDTSGGSSIEPTDPQPPAKAVASVKSRFLKADSVHRHYLVNVKDTLGNSYSFIDTALTLSDVRKSEVVRKQAEQINRFYNSDKNVNFYLYVAKRLQDTDYYESIIPDEASTKPYYDTFVSLLDPGITYEAFELPDVFYRHDYVWKTDHHWNAEGSYVGYRQIIEMMRRDTPSILPPREPVSKEMIEGSRFYGSFARSCAYATMWDNFGAFNYGLPAHTIAPTYDFLQTMQNLRKNPPTKINQNIYALCYPYISRLSFPENHTGRNLLVIGDSYAKGIAEALGSSFDNTYLYYFNSYSGLNYNKVIRDNQITDVLFLQFSERIVFDALGDNRFNFIKTDS